MIPTKCEMKNELEENEIDPNKSNEEKAAAVECSEKEVSL